MDSRLLMSGMTERGCAAGGGVIAPADVVASASVPLPALSPAGGWYPVAGPESRHKKKEATLR